MSAGRPAHHSQPRTPLENCRFVSLANTILSCACSITFHALITKGSFAAITYTASTPLPLSCATSACRLHAAATNLVHLGHERRDVIHVAAPLADHARAPSHLPSGRKGTRHRHNNHLLALPLVVGLHRLGHTARLAGVELRRPGHVGNRRVRDSLALRRRLARQRKPHTVHGARTIV